MSASERALLVLRVRPCAHLREISEQFLQFVARVAQAALCGFERHARGGCNVIHAHVAFGLQQEGFTLVGGSFQWRRAALLLARATSPAAAGRGGNRPRDRRTSIRRRRSGVDTGVVFRGAAWSITRLRAIVNSQVLNFAVGS